MQGHRGPPPSAPLLSLGDLAESSYCPSPILWPRPGPTLVGMEKAGWPGPCLVSTHFLHLLNQSPGTFPAHPQGQPRVEGWVPLRPEMSVKYHEPPQAGTKENFPAGWGQASAVGTLQRSTSCPVPRLVFHPTPSRDEAPGNVVPRSHSLFLPTGTQLEKLMESMRNDIASHPPVEGSYAPRRGEFCIAKFVDGEW